MRVAGNRSLRNIHVAGEYGSSFLLNRPILQAAYVERCQMLVPLQFI
jgi:hypothetical protein